MIGRRPTFLYENFENSDVFFCHQRSLKFERKKKNPKLIVWKIIGFVLLIQTMMSYSKESTRALHSSVHTR